MKRYAPALLLAALLCSCAAPHTALRQYQATFLTLFDTVTTVVGYAQREEDFRAQAQTLHDQLLEYHQLFDIYREYPGIHNLKTVNEQAGIAPVEVDARLIALLLDCRTLYQQTGGRVNAAMGSVLALWRTARLSGVTDPAHAALPDRDALREAASHIRFDTVHIDPEASTLYLSDPAQRLDVGAIAKGWAVEQVCRQAPAGLLVSVGGNVRATGPRPTDGSHWVVGIQDPAGEGYLHTLYLSQGSVVTSGDYQRCFTVDGIRYGHILDPDTLYPPRQWQSVTVLCADSGLADALSTALFTLPLAEGQALADQLGAEAFWLAADGQEYTTPGFAAQLKY